MGLGRFITVEGGEGVGKSSFTQALSQWFASQNKPLMVTREPGGTPIAQALRQIFISPPEQERLRIESEAFLISAARAQHVHLRILPALTNGSWVLCDRFADSLRVYQGSIGRLPEDQLEVLIKMSCGALNPDLTILLDCDVATSRKRLENRAQQLAAANASGDGASRFDTLGEKFHEQVRASFLDLAKKNAQRFLVVNAAQATEDMVQDVVQMMKRRWPSEFIL